MRGRSQALRWASANLIRKRIARDEGQTTEFKESLGLKDQIIEAAVAFANSRGGVVLVGVRNDQTIVGVQVGVDTQEKLANELKRRTLPPILPEIAVRELGGRTLLAIRVESVGTREVVYLDGGRPLKRVGKSNHIMSHAEQRRRAGFRRENSLRKVDAAVIPGRDASWQERDRVRIETYTKNRGLFLVHSWQPSEEAGQLADVVIRLQQHYPPDHVKADLPLPDGKIKSVEYYLGPKFFTNTVVKTDPGDGFKLEVSAYGPVLCMAIVHFDDGHKPVQLQRYIDLL